MVRASSELRERVKLLGSPAGSPRKAQTTSFAPVGRQGQVLGERMGWSLLGSNGTDSSDSRSRRSSACSHQRGWNLIETGMPARHESSP